MRRVTAAPQHWGPVARSADRSMILEQASETKVSAKWERNRCQNEGSWVPKSSKIYAKSAQARSKIYENRSMKPSWGDLVPSWLQVGGPWPILAPSLGVLGRSWLQDCGFGLHLGSQMGPQIHQNPSQERSDMLSFLSSI